MWGLHESDVFFQHTSQKPNHTEIWEMWRPRQHCELWTFPQTIPDYFLSCGSVHYPAERGQCYQGVLLPWRGVLGVQRCGTCQSNILMNVRTQGFTAEHCLEHHTAPAWLLFSCSASHRPTQLSTLCKRNCHPSHQDNFFHWSVVLMIACP